MKFPKTLLWINALLFILFGIGFILAPQFLSQLITGATPSTTSALTDMRATYGGTSFGIGLFFGLCARQPSSLRMGLTASLLILASIAGGRFVGILIDGSPNYFMFVLLVAEILFVGLIVAALKQTAANK